LHDAYMRLNCRIIEGYIPQSYCKQYNKAQRKSVELTL
jgi:hypothetical protein